ncbi:hypothetical protein Tco_1421687 [Tanacetum coccineum]
MHQALSSIPAIVDHYINNKLGEAINKAIQAHNLDCKQEAQDEKNQYIGLVDTSIRTIIKEEVTTQLPQILPQVVSDFATPSTYEAAASLSEFELTKILLDKMAESKSLLRADYKKKLYNALVESYNTDKDLFNTYGEVFTSKEKKSSSTSKDASQSQHKHSGKCAYAEKPSHTIDDLGVLQDQEFDTGNNDEHPTDKEVSKADWFKKPERPPTPDSDWNKRHHVDSQPPQTWISQVVRAKEPCSSFDGSWKRIIAVTILTILKKYDYGHLEEIEVCREDQKLYKFREGDFPRLRLQDIEDMLLLLIQQKLTNLTINEQYALNVALRNKDGISAKEEMEWFRQMKDSGYGSGYRQAAL